LLVVAVEAVMEVLIAVEPGAVQEVIKNQLIPFLCPLLLIRHIE